MAFLSTRPLWLALCVMGCSGEDAAGNSTVDVAAAASRAQADIAHYAASPAGRRAEPTSVAPPLADSATPQEVVRRYLEALAARRYGEAWALWAEGGRASGMAQAAFAASFDRYASYRAAVGAPGAVEAGAGQRYVTVPVVVTGTLRSGGPFRLEGPVVLHTIAQGIESDQPHAHAWRIRSSELKPRPGGATGASR